MSQWQGGFPAQVLVNLLYINQFWLTTWCKHSFSLTPWFDNLQNCSEIFLTCKTEQAVLCCDRMEEEMVLQTVEKTPQYRRQKNCIEIYQLPLSTEMAVAVSSPKSNLWMLVFFQFISNIYNGCFGESFTGCQRKRLIDRVLLLKNVHFG